MRRKSAFTLLELIAGMMATLIIILGVTSFYVIEYNFRRTIQDDATVSREARIAMDSMVATLRWAKKDSISINGSSIDAVISGGRLPYIPADTRVSYDQNGEYLMYNQFGQSAIQLARHIYSFTPTLDKTCDPYMLILRLTTQKRNSQMSLVTRVRILGDY